MTQSMLTAVPTDHAMFKAAVKEAVAEALLEQRELLYDVLAEVIEDIGLTKAMLESEGDELVSREEVFKVLEGRE